MFFYNFAPLKTKTVKKILKFIPVWTLSVIATAVICYLLLARNPFGSELMEFRFGDKIAHVVAFMILAMVYIFDYIRYRVPHHTRFDVEIAFAVCAAMVGGMLEIAQLVMRNGRSYDPYDWLADIIGAALGYLIMKLFLITPIRHWLKRRRHHHHHHNHQE